ncbi:copper chaperone PCu(A)C [Palleronia aestuarii]|nr:copper chaperone PCu(A)C [Palleronia aestuarii]
MRRRELAEGLVIPAGESADLAPGGLHLMLMHLRGALVEGETVDLTLTFEIAGEVTVPLAIGASNAD